MKINSIEDLFKANIPYPVLNDIHGRIRDWLASGGSVENDYVKQQFRYAEKVTDFINKTNLK